MVDTSQVHYISFANQEVAVLSDEPEIIAPFLLSFRGLLVDEPADILATLSVVKDQAGYRVEGARLFEGENETPHGVLQCLKFEVIHRFVEVHPELLWLHAGAASHEGKAVVLCGAWGSGKSTLVGHLCKKGWTYLSDDIVPIHMAESKLVAFPLTPMMRAHERSDEKNMLSPTEISNLDKHIVDLDAESFATSTKSIAAIVFPQYDPETKHMELSPIAPATATMELLRNCLDLKFRQEEAVHYLGGLVEKLPVHILRYNKGDKAADLLMQAHEHNYA